MKTRDTFLVALALTLGCGGGPPRGDHGWVVDGTLVPDEPWRGHDGPFLAALFLTDDAEAVYDRWNTQPGNFKSGNIHEAPPGATVEAVVVFTRCQVDEHGDCHVWGTATVESDGRVLVQHTEVPLWVGKPPPPDPALGIAEHGVALVVEQAASFYSFRMVVSDRVARREVQLVEHLSVRKAATE